MERRLISRRFRIVGSKASIFSLYTDFTLRAREWPQHTLRRNVQDYLRDHWPVRTEVVDHLVVR